MTARTLAAEHARPLALRPELGTVGAWTLGFALVGYLALKGGGFDVVVRSQVGIGIWWIVLLGAALGVLPRQRVGRLGLSALGLLAAFTAFSALSALWSESPERAISETARNVTLLGVLVLAVTTLRPVHIRPLVKGVFCAIVLVGGLACLSRLHPAWFPEAETSQFLPSAQSRLSYALNYWNSLGAFMAIAMPLGFAISMTARSVAGRAMSLAVIPVLALACLLTISRGGVIASVIGVVATVALTPDRGRLLAKVALAGLGTAILVKGAIQRDALRDGLSGRLAHEQGDELLIIAIVVVAGIALVHSGLSLARAGGLLPNPRQMRPSLARLTWVAVASLVIGGATAFVASGELGDRWEEFKRPGVMTETGFSRLGNANGAGRYEFWVSSVDAFKQAPVVGLGAGSFENWWARNAKHRQTVRNAHSLYAESLAELGLIGALMIGGFILLVIGAGIRAVRRSAGPPAALLAGATASCVAFAFAAAVDWHWQVTVIPAVFILLGAALVAKQGDPAGAAGRPVRAAVVVVAVIALVGLVVPLASTTQLRASQNAALANDLDPALRRAGTAGRLEPYAASPQLQRALVFELRGDLAAAVAAARAAERKEPTNWRAPFVLARLHAARGDTSAAVRAFERAESLNKAALFLR